MGSDNQQNEKEEIKKCEVKLTLYDRIRREILKWPVKEIVSYALRLLDKLYFRKDTRKIIQSWYKPSVDAAVIIAMSYLVNASNCKPVQIDYGNSKITLNKCKYKRKVIEHVANRYGVSPKTVSHHIKYLSRFLGLMWEL
ncbi:hypothetical protein Pogu_0625 [Pyrobaculum oguniense TE7]|uniref:Uncharacterized protein n=1 Tax=Pyrobaculum oguniense (strain DSM 13380 / JCM 10595 / TE7) TaxID=698757 RepID=H6Q7Z5_PYROT|nr:hypothetical protein Pogu_0625 [Pyrobaculum oguniense TE7]